MYNFTPPVNTYTQDKAIEACRRLLNLLGGDKYDEWYASAILGGRDVGPYWKPDYAMLRDLAEAEYTRLTICTCTPRDEIACPACMFALDKQAADLEPDGFPF